MSQIYVDIGIHSRHVRVTAVCDVNLDADNTPEERHDSNEANALTLIEEALRPLVDAGIVRIDEFTMGYVPDGNGGVVR